MNKFDVNRYEGVFHYFDENRDGKISPSELQACVMRIGGGELLLEESEAVIECLDSDGDGMLELDDFVGLMEAEGEEEKMRDTRQAFGMYEMDGSGFITARSLKRMLSRLGMSRPMDECSIMISRFDLNDDGMLSFDEFCIMMHN
ncbi:PREDICTED: calcium-binding protein CML37-like [Nelumbo nucifera]|uniref:Calcium-binding protein CML37-like n=1 Tax=Nelumbo nucifera TaxID=4432 RepID=A0A1U7ZKR4_NELNU|nr:PREDICTED: calcium-binding protein CML37-like [Nelumbo nucifera]